MADPAVVYTRLDRITADQFNTGFNALQATIEAEKEYYTTDAYSLAKVKNLLYDQFNIAASSGVIYKIEYNGRLAVICGSIIDGNYLEDRVGFVYPDAEGSLAYQYSDNFLSNTEPGMKAFLPTVNCVGIKTYCNNNRNLYSHKIALAAKSYCEHTLTEELAGENGAVMMYQRYITV